MGDEDLAQLQARLLDLHKRLSSNHAASNVDLTIAPDTDPNTTKRNLVATIDDSVASVNSELEIEVSNSQHNASESSLIQFPVQPSEPNLSSVQFIPGAIFSSDPHFDSITAFLTAHRQATTNRLPTDKFTSTSNPSLVNFDDSPVPSGCSPQPAVAADLVSPSTGDPPRNKEPTGSRPKFDARDKDCLSLSSKTSPSLPLSSEAVDINTVTGKDHLNESEALPIQSFSGSTNIPPLSVPVLFNLPSAPTHGD